jgi:hypothetical protein
MRPISPYLMKKLFIVRSRYDGLMTNPCGVARSPRMGLSGKTATRVIKLKKNLHTIAPGIQGMQDRCVKTCRECAGLSTGDLHEEDYHPFSCQAYRNRGCSGLCLFRDAEFGRRE